MHHGVGGPLKCNSRYTGDTRFQPTFEGVPARDGWSDV